MVTFESVLRSLESMGLTDVLLPFFLIFVITFAVLRRAHIFGTDDQTKVYEIVLSTILGLVVVIPHVLGRYPPGADVVNIINAALPNVAVVIVAVIFVFLILGVFGAKQNWPNKMSGWIALASFLVVGYIFGSAAGWWQNSTFNNYLDPDTQALLIVVGVFALIIWFITRNPSSTTFGDTAKKALDAIGDIGKGGSE